LGTFLELTLPELPENRRTRLRQRLAVALGRFLARLHGAGVSHDDLHANNLLLALSTDDEPSLHLVDLHAVRLRAPLDCCARWSTLVSFTRGFVSGAGRADRLRFWKSYQEASADSSYRETMNLDAAHDLEERTWRSNLRFWGGRDRRCLEDNRYYRRV